MNYCSHCGGPLRHAVPPGDDRPRGLCDACGRVSYRNPRLIVGTLPVHGDRILLCRRAIEPQYGMWTLPSGFMECGETAEAGALRETMEEARARARIERLFAVYSLDHFDQVYLLYLARLLDLDFAAGEESLDVRLFTPHEIPWDEIAFHAVTFCLRQYLEDADSPATRIGSYGGAHEPDRAEEADGE